MRVPGLSPIVPRIVLATFGSLGDLHPFLALGEALLARGAEVTVAASESYRERVCALGLGFAPLSPDFSRWERDTDAMRHAMDLRGGSDWIFRNMVAPFVEQTGPELLRACEGADAIVHSTLVLGAAPVAEKAGLPRFAVTLQPMVMFSALDPPATEASPVASALFRTHPAVARAMFALARTVSRPWFAPVARLRRSLGVSPHFANPVFDAAAGAAGHLAMFSPHFAPDPGDWPANTTQTGFAYFDHTPEHRGLSPGLQSFLDAGEPPLVFTLGSAAVWVPGEFFARAREAARALGRRAVLLVGDRVPFAGETSDDLFVGAYAPYSALFPHAAVVVHQGGIGTTAQALRAGRPQLIVPWSHDQPDNAVRCVRLGVARTLRRSHADAGAMTRELRALLADAGASARAAALGQAIRAERGADAAAETVLTAVGGSTTGR